MTGQEAIIEALESGAATGSLTRLRRIDTHMSHVFLGDDRAYKLKAPAHFPFADMRTLEARRLSCQEELAVNRRLAPDLYLAVEPVTRDLEGRIRVGGQGEVLDHVVVMRRFEDGGLLDERARNGALEPQQIIEAVDAVARFHGELPPHLETGRDVDYRRIVEGLRATDAEGAEALGLSPSTEALWLALDQEIERQAPRIERRRRAGKVRRGHGDLHLRNICVFRGRVVPFDALEFAPALATADVLYDLAFLLMDLRARDLPAYANLAMNRYWDQAGEEEDGLGLLPLFTSLRAAVRMAVAMEAGDPVEADRYRRLAMTLLPHPQPRLVAIGGLSGSGKSSVARGLAPRLGGPCGARLLRTDVVRRTAGLGPPAYSQDSRMEVYRMFERRVSEALAAGAVVVADATFREAQPREGIVRAAGRRPLSRLWLQAPADVRAARVAGRTGDESEATAEVALAQSEPSSLEGWTVIDANRPSDQVVDDVARRLSGIATG